MEVGQELVGGSELITGRDEDVCLAREGVKPPRRVGRRLQKAQHRRAHRNHLVSLVAGGVNGRGGLGGDLTPFGMHLVIGHVFDLDRKKSSGTDVERERDPLDSPRVEGIQERGREVQAGRRRRHGTRDPGKHRLVIARVPGVGKIRTLDVGGQGHGAEALQGGLQIGAALFEGKRHFAGLALGFDFGREAGSEIDAVALFEPPRRPREGSPGGGVDGLVQRHLHLGHAAPTRQAHRDDLRVVEYQDVAWAQVPGQVGYAGVSEFPADHQHARRVSRRHRPLRDAGAREIEVERVHLHGAASGREEGANVTRGWRRRPLPVEPAVDRTFTRS